MQQSRFFLSNPGHLGFKSCTHIAKEFRFKLVTKTQTIIKCLS